jgi:hypothetical protein
MHQQDGQQAVFRAPAATGDTGAKTAALAQARGKPAAATSKRSGQLTEPNQHLKFRHGREENRSSILRLRSSFGQIGS